MKKITALSLLVSIIYSEVSAQTSQFIVTDKYDTVYYKKVNPDFGQKITGHKENGEKVKYEAKNVLYYNDNDGLKEVVTKEGTKGWEKGWDIMLVRMRSKENARILLHTNMTGNYGENVIFYFFNKDGFVAEVDKNNIEDIFSKYFSDCPDLLKEIEGKDGKQIYKYINLHAKLYVENCAPAYNVGVKTVNYR